MDDGKSEEQGKHSTKVASLIGAKNQTYVANLEHSKKKGNKGKIIIRTDAVKESNKSLKMTLVAKNLKSKKKMGLFSTNNPFLVIRRPLSQDIDNVSDTNSLKVYSSEPLRDTTNPWWEIPIIKFQTLCNSDPDMPLVFEIWSFQDSGKHRLYGRVKTSVNDIIRYANTDLDVIRKDGKHKGKLTFTDVQMFEVPTMMDYLRSGWIISLSVAIDFTASNGDLSDPNSLHYINPYDPMKMTAYEAAIFQVGSILEPYDSDRQFPVFGFGAKPRFMGVNDVSHCFHLNGLENPQVVGVKGILDAYRNALNGGIGFYGPTNFTPCLQTMMDYIQGRQGYAEYHIMLYITDGEITDLQATIDT
jgi:hypothetical protein